MATFPDTTILPETRADLEALIEAAIARLDDIDPDPDDEPSLGAPEAALVGTSTYFGPMTGLRRTDALSQVAWATGGSDDREADTADDEDGGDLEPSLGACNPHGVYGSDAFAIICYNRRHPGEGAGELSRSPATSQLGWGNGGSDDREIACEDEGAQCDDEGFADEDLDYSTEWPKECTPARFQAVAS